jgi:hypothetical protein
MRTKWALSACAAACVCSGALSAGANIQSDRWFHEVTQDGRDVRFMIQLIEEDPPNFDTTFMLTRGDKTFFEHKLFVREEADETVGPGACIEDNMADGPIADCDSDGTAECAGICGTAYRYAYVDKCVPLDVGIMYDLYDESTFLPDGGIPTTGPGSEGYSYIFDMMPTDAGCDDAGADADSDSDADADTDTDTDTDADDADSSSCSASPGLGASPEAGLAALMLLVGLGGVCVARRKRAR